MKVAIMLNASWLDPERRAAFDKAFGKDSRHFYRLKSVPPFKETAIDLSGDLTEAEVEIVFLLERNGGLGQQGLTFSPRYYTDDIIVFQVAPHILKVDMDLLIQWFKRRWSMDFEALFTTTKKKKARRKKKTALALQPSKSAL